MNELSAGNLFSAAAMAPKEIPKKKRGRPSKADAMAREAEADANDELLSPEQVKPKIRRRKSNLELQSLAELSNQDEGQESRDELEPPGDKRAHRRTGDVIASADELEQQSTSTPRPTIHKNASQSRHGKEATGSHRIGQEQQVRKKRGRPSLAGVAEKISSADKQESQARRMPGRPKKTQSSKSQSKIIINGDGEVEEQLEEPRSRKRRGRPPIAQRTEVTKEAGSSSDQPPTRKRNRQQADTENESEQLPEEGERSRKRRNRSSNAELINQDALTKKRKRRQEVDVEESEAVYVPKYRHIAVVNRNVPRHTIDTKWNPLPRVAVDRVGQIFQDVERSVVERIQNDGRRAQARTAVQISVQKMMRKLNKLPFPPSANTQRENDFDLEKTLDSSTVLEDRLTPLLHSIDLLKVEIKREEKRLEAETEELNELESNAKADASRRMQAAKKLHTVLRDTSDNLLDRVMSDGFTKPDFQGPPLIASSADDELKPSIAELQSHLDSMKNNMAQVEGLGVAMSKSRAAVQDVLFRHLDTERYEHVVLG